MGLHPRKGHWVTLAAPLASLLVGGSPPAAMEPTSVPAPCGSRSPAELLLISSAGPLSRSFDPVTPSSGSERVLEPLKEATYEQPISSPSILVAMLLGVEALCAEPSAKDDPSSPQPLAGAGPSGDSLDLA
ncbi:hypothetical protein GW17_00009948 [Ensete ventricosum]|nr:hypothetical protein GW17_00009948 [Ensete ventricosum]